MAVLLVAPLAAGCFGEEGPAAAQAAPTWRTGDWFEYEVTDGNGTFTTTFVVQSGATFRARHFNHLYVPRPEFDSPFMHLDEDLAPIGERWADLLRFPLEPGATYPAVVDGAQVMLKVGTTRLATPMGRLWVYDVRPQDGSDSPIAVTYSPEHRALTTIEWSDRDGQRIESWRLLSAGRNYPWGGLVPWRLGDWWTFEARSWNFTGQLTLVHTQQRVEATEIAAFPVWIAEATRAADLALGTPFLRVDQRNMHPRSGSFSVLISKSYDFPLQHLQNWTSFANNVPFRAFVQWDPHIPIGNGSAYGFHVRALTLQDTVASYNYVPAVKWFSEFQLKNAKTGRVELDWRLVDFGSGYQGPLERVLRFPLKNGSVGGSVHEERVQVNATTQFLNLATRMVFAADATPPTVTLIDPDGAPRARLVGAACGRPTCFVPDELRVPARPGSWTLRVDAPADTLVQYELRDFTVKVLQLDFRTSKR